MTEITDEDIEHLKHQDFKNKKHEKGCTCGYCELKRWEKEQQQLRKEFNNRTESLKLTKEARDELFNKFIACWDAGFKCLYCGRKMDLHFESEYSFTIDHTIPKAKNGQNTVQNLEFVCRTCNFLKGNKDAEQYINKMGWLIARKNRKECWKARNSTKKDKPIRDSYKDILERRGGL